MTAGAPDDPCEVRPGTILTMSKNSDKERGEKRGVLSTGRANDTEDADDAADDED